MHVRLRNTGFIDNVEAEPIDNIGNIPSSLTRKARLVYVGDFESMDGPVKVTEEHLTKIAENYNGKLAKLKRLATGAVPIASNPPVQLDHTRSSRDTVGRIESTPLTVEDWTDEEGKTRKGLYGHVRFLGKDNVERVMDGRWSTLSIGADFDKGKLDELSVTPFPAAENATVLRRLSKEVCFEDEHGGKYDIAVFVDTEDGLYEAFVDGKSLGKYLSEAAALEKAQEEANRLCKEKAELSKKNEGTKMQIALLKGRLEAHFKLKKKMSDEEVKEKLKKLEESEDEEELKKLAEEMDEEEKKEKDEKEEKLSKARENVTRLGAEFRSRKESATLAARAAKIGSRLSVIRSSGRITPAEVKKIDVKGLAAKGDEAIDAVLKSYEDRQPVILVGQLGSMKPMSLKDVKAAGNKINMAQLELETRKNMSMLRHTVDEKKLGEGDASPDNVNIHIDTDPHTDMNAMESDYTSICSLMDTGDTNGAKEKLKGFMDRMKSMGCYGMAEPVMHEQSMAQLAALETEVTEMSKKFDEAIGLAQSLASGE